MSVYSLYSFLFSYSHFTDIFFTLLVALRLRGVYKCFHFNSKCGVCFGKVTGKCPGSIVLGKKPPVIDTKSPV